MTFNENPHVMAYRIAKIVHDCDVLLASENMAVDDRVKVSATRCRWLYEAKERDIETKVVLHCTYEVLGLRLN